MGRVNEDSLKLNCAHRYLVFCADLNLVDVDCILQGYTVDFVLASKVIGLEVNVDKTDYIFISRDKN
jgi:hypothetical protein